MMPVRVGQARRTIYAAATALLLLSAGAERAVAQQLQQLPSVADLVSRLTPAVVDIAVSQGAESADAQNPPMPELPPDSPFRQYFDDFFKRQQRGQSPQQRPVNAMGSGFVIDSAGLVVTNNHVIEGADSIQVHFTDGKTLKAELVGRDPKIDLAVLRVKPEQPLTSLKFGDSDLLRVGDWVIAVGNPFGLGGSVSLGIVSARNRDINAGPYDDFIQTDAAINKGNSGGPLFNMAGEVVGINTAIYSPSGGSVGIGFSVPSRTARGIIDQLVKYGETRRGWLGVRIQSVTDDLVESLGLDKARGALIADVTPTGPAEKAGIESGDVVIEFDSRPIKEMKDLPRLVADTAIGKKVAVKVLRKGKEVMITAEVGRLEDGEKLVAQAGAGGAGGLAGATVTVLGMTVSQITDDLRKRFSIDANVKGAVVTTVEPNSTAADKKIEPGDVITEAGEKPVGKPGDVEASVKDAEKDKKNSVLMLVSKGGKQGEMRFIAVRLKK
jgi:serine protease Do